MNIRVQLSDDDTDNDILIKVKKIYNGGINDYLLEHADYKYFQFDTSDRPHYYKKEFREIQWFEGYLICRKSYKLNIISCRIQVKN